jgi:hypothetical protein
VVEHTVEDQPQATLVGRGHQGVEVAFVAEPGVDLEVVDRVVPMCFRGEDRTEQQPVAAEFDRVVEPCLQVPQPVPDRLLRGQCRSFRARETERVHMPQNCMISP